MVERLRRNATKTRKRAGGNYRNPPESTRFKPGQSGNPKGRPKGVKNFETDLLEALLEPVEIKNANGRRTMTTAQKAVARKLVAKAREGDPRACQQLINLILRSPKGNNSEAPAIVLDNDDRAILDEYYYDRRAREAEQAASGSLPTQPARSNSVTPLRISHERRSRS
jgi:hypothetical protein